MIDKLMQHDVIPIKSVIDNFGNPSDTNLATERGFFEYDERSTFDSDGNVVRCVGNLYLKADSGFDPKLSIKWKFKDVKNDRTLQLEEFKVIDDPRTGNTHHFEILIR